MHSAHMDRNSCKLFQMLQGTAALDYSLERVVGHSFGKAYNIDGQQAEAMAVQINSMLPPQATNTDARSDVAENQVDKPLVDARGGGYCLGVMREAVGIAWE